MFRKNSKIIALAIISLLITTTTIAGGFCGNAILEGNEQCDDGDNNSGDGCSDTCAVEYGFECTSPFQPLNTFNLVEDPGFEIGAGSPNWMNLSDATFPPVFCTAPGCPETSGSRNGLGWLRMGDKPVGGPPATNWQVFQDVVIEPGFSYLRFDVSNYQCGSNPGNNNFGIFLDQFQIWATNSLDPACGEPAYRTVTLNLDDVLGGPWDNGASATLRLGGSASSNQTHVSFDNMQISKPFGSPTPSICTLIPNVSSYLPFEGITGELGPPDFFQSSIGNIDLPWVTTGNGDCNFGIPDNFTGQPGDAACIDSSALPTGPGTLVESYFCAAPVDLTGKVGSFFTFTVNYQPRNVSGADFFGVWVGTSPFLGPLSAGIGDAVFFSNQPIGVFGQAPGETFTVFPPDIDDKPEVYICFGYGNKDEDFGYVQVDSVFLQSQGCLDDFEEDKLMSCFDNCVNEFNPAPQLDSDNDGIGNACDPDIFRSVGVGRAEGGNGNDCIVNFFDFFVLNEAAFSTPLSENWNPDADFNDDGVVNFLDVFIFSTYFLAPPGPSGLSTACDSQL